MEEETTRFSIFQNNLRRIEEHNRKFKAGNVSYSQAVNQFADKTHEEFVAFLKRQSAARPKLNTVYKKPNPVAIPDSIDWRNYGAVSAVKDQGYCGSCWAFSATGVLESTYYLKTQQMVLFSEQQLVDCDTNQLACDGGDEGIALHYIKDNGIQTEDGYPYEGVKKTCRYNQNNKVNLQINEVVELQSNNEQELLQAVGSIGPVSVALDATNIDSYSGGVFDNTDCSVEGVNHAVLAVGYGHDSQSGLDYWLVKNSWTTDWGEAGYLRIKRGVNLCGIASENIYPTLY